MVKDKPPTREDMRKAEKEIGDNIPQSMIGLDNGDIRNVTTPDENTATDTEEETDPSSRH